MLRKMHEFYDRNPKQLMPPVIYVLTHVDQVPEHLTGEAMAAVAADLGTDAAQVVVACGQWGG